MGAPKKRDLSSGIRPAKSETRKNLAGASWPAAAIPVILVLFWAGWLSASGYADGPAPDDHVNHLGLAIGPVHNLHEKSSFLGLGLEYERLLPVWNGSLGIGMAAEMVFDEHKHYVISLLTCFHPVRPLTLSLAPGVMFIDRNGSESRAAIHFGAEYEFEVGMVFLAPAAEIGFAGDDVHLMLGLHIGFGF